MAVNMVPTKSVVVVRDGKRVKPEIGKSFSFTKEERDALLEADSTVLRKPVNEDDAADDADTAGSGAEASQAKAAGGKKAATAGKSDAEAKGKTAPPAGEGGGKGAGSDDDL